MRKKISFFVSYAHRNQQLANGFIEKLKDVLAPSKRYEYALWKDDALVIGESWKTQIIKAIDECGFGLLLISPAFLASEFITKNELPSFVILE